MCADFSNIEFEDLLVQYKFFIENIYNACSCLEELIFLLKIFLSDYYNFRNFEEDFASELELILAYFENYYQVLFSIVEELNQFSLSDRRKKEDIKWGWSNVCLFYPKYYIEGDIYVSSDYQID
ncbi:hypothetical protein IKB17_03930 [bacterium]|nr:hypothetical protein [bacterium]